MFTKTNIISMAVLTAMITMAFFSSNASAFESFIPYSELNSTQQNENYIGYHITDLKIFIWYHNNHKSGFVLDTVNTDEEQKQLDNGDNKPTQHEQNPQLIKAALNFYIPS